MAEVTRIGAPAETEIGRMLRELAKLADAGGMTGVAVVWTDENGVPQTTWNFPDGLNAAAAAAFLLRDATSPPGD